jgi:hypothetical protein
MMMAALMQAAQKGKKRSRPKPKGRKGRAAKKR